MSKRALGKGLESLLNSKTAGSSSLDPNSQVQEEQPVGQVGHGLGVLLKHGQNGKGQATGQLASSSRETAGPRGLFGLPRWYFLTVDLFLLLLAAVIIFSGTNPPGVFKLTFSGLIVALGATTAILAFVRPGMTAVDPAEQPADHWALVECLGIDGKPKHLLVHLQGPVFIGELVQKNDREKSIIPLWMEGKAGLADPLVAHLIREAEYKWATGSNAPTAPPPRLLPLQGAKIPWITGL